MTGHFCSCGTARRISTLCSYYICHSQPCPGSSSGEPHKAWEFRLHEELHQEGGDVQPCDTDTERSIFLSGVWSASSTSHSFHSPENSDRGHFMTQPTRALKGDAMQRAEHHQVYRHQEPTAADAITCRLFKGPRG